MFDYFIFLLLFIVFLCWFPLPFTDESLTLLRCFRLVHHTHVVDVVSMYVMVGLAGRSCTGAIDFADIKGYAALILYLRMT